MKTNEQNEPVLKRYVGRVSQKGVLISGEYVDWFTDDNDARIGRVTHAPNQVKWSLRDS